MFFKTMRPTREDTLLNMALVLSKRSTCVRRQVACILVNERGHILSTGYNGVPAGWYHCLDHPCLAADAESGTALEQCLAIHAEQNALLQCTDVFKIEAAFCTDSPCVHCIKLLLNTSCQRIVFRKEYPHPDSKQLWTRDGRIWIHQP